MLLRNSGDEALIPLIVAWETGRGCFDQICIVF